MREGVEARLRALARRAGWSSAPPAIVAAGLALAIVAVGVALWRWWPAAGSSGELAARVTGAVAGGAPSRAGTRTSVPAAVVAAPGDAVASEATMYVDVVGAVRHPGVYLLEGGARVESAVQAAGGALGDADTDAINLAAKVADGDQVVVPTHDQVDKGSLPAPVGGAAAGGVVGAAGAAAKVDLNTADATQLDALPGVGPSTAAKIVADRQTNGPFKTVDDLGRVPGIGPKKLDSLKDLVVVH
ncbi:MAG: ComEA family DNA-binding protein [Coriobacteriia bacterium]|nr:ComEA family DNA-binding protein [Coriobacteriia bacterium]